MDSKLQIISGKYRGRRLNLPPNARPTQNRARIALFNMMADGIINRADNLLVWDAFAGSGAFGLECLSRYENVSVVFTDNAADSVQTVNKNINLLAENHRCKMIKTDAIDEIQNTGPDAGLIFLDPPYAQPELGICFVKKITPVAKTGTILIWEQENGQSFMPDADAWDLLRDKIYGRARFLILRKI